MSKHIVVGYDGSASAAAAVAWAADEASLRGADLEVVSCYTLPTMAATAFGWGVSETLAALMDDATRHATAAIEQLATSHPDLATSMRVMMGPASSELMHGRAADDLIVVGASGHHGAGAFWIGSTARQLVRHSPCPVAVVRDDGAGVTPVRVVVGTDGSASSEAAVEWAGEQADRHQVGLVIVHAWSYPYVEVTAGSVATRDLMRVDAALVLEHAVDAARARVGVDVEGQLVDNSSVPGLLDAVRDGDLLVLGSRGRGPIAAGLLGSTVNAVLDRAHVPVVVVPHHEEG